jgi:hypothetical protein
MDTHRPTISSTLQQSVADLTGLTEKLQAQMTDLSNAVKVMQAPAPAPPPGAGALARRRARPLPGNPARVIRRNSTTTRTRDRQRRQGRYCAPGIHQVSCAASASTDLAPNAQYYIGTIHFAQADYPTALEGFRRRAREVLG